MDNKIKEFIESLNNKYISKKDIILIKKKYHNLYTDINNLFIFRKLKYIKFIMMYLFIEQYTNKHNKKYIKSELIKSKSILDNINGYPLDRNQRIAVLTDEDNVLVIAGAGSGKTLTIIGKIRYLIEVKKIRPKDILCISFTNESTKSIKNSIDKYYGYEVDIKTFHKLALHILKGKNISVAPSDYLDYLITEYFNGDIEMEENNLFYLKEYFRLSYGNDSLKEEYLINLKRVIITFINVFKANDYEKEYFKNLFFFIEKIKDRKKRKINKLLLLIIFNIYLKYKEELDSGNTIDFNDMINLANDEVKSKRLKLNYKHIIIDEYQDSSLTRFNLIKNIIDINNAKLFVVGDDFQSIYRFTGCNLNIFLKFNKYIGYAKVLKINRTYRSPKGVVEVAGNFIMKNKKQTKKTLLTSKKIKKPITISYYKSIINSIITIIGRIYLENKGRILILGRNNNDINMIIDNINFINRDGIITYTKNENIELSYLTVHKSKGLESDNVIIINMINSIIGFPNKIKDIEIVNLIMKKEDFPFEEERRLFYVALTRTKNKVYLLVPIRNESIFIQELKKDYKKNIKIEYLQ